MTADTEVADARPGRPQAWALALAVLLGAACCVFVSLGRSNLAAVLAWPASVGLFLWSVRPSRTGRTARLPRADLLLAVLLPLVPVLVRVLLTSPYRVHGDELITAFYSAHDDFSPRRFFEGVPQAQDWVCQFPSLYFVLQRGFYLAFGDGLEQVRWSGVPYVWLSGFALFLAARRMLGRATAVIAVLLYACLALALYIETTGLMFLSGTAAFTVLFACAVRLFQEGGTWNAAATGVAAGLCYLLYPSSFIALPVLAVFAVIAFFRARRLLLARWVVWPALGFALVLAPFVPHAVKTRNYFTERSGQLFFMVESSPELDAMTAAEKAAVLFPRNLKSSLQSFYKPGLGGFGGYWFGRLAIFDPASFAAFVLGLLGAIVLARRRPEIGVALFAIALALLTGVVLMVPPAGYHRLSVVYPLLGLVLAVPFRLLALLPAGHPAVASRAVRAAVAALGVAFLGSVNVERFSKVALEEFTPDDMFLASWVNTRYPDRKLWVGAFPGHGYEKVAYFATPRRRGPVLSQYHADLIREFDEKEPYVVVMIFPEGFEQRFKNIDPNGRFAFYRDAWGLFVNGGPPAAP